MDVARLETDLNLFIDRNDFGVLVQVVFPRESDTTPVGPRAHMSHANPPRPVLIVVGPKGVAFVAPCLSPSPSVFLSLSLVAIPRLVATTTGTRYILPDR